MRKSRREFRLTDAEIAMLTLAGEYYESGEAFAKRYGFDPKDWPHRGFVLRGSDADINGGIRWLTWDRRLGWVRW